MRVSRNKKVSVVKKKLHALLTPVSEKYASLKSLSAVIDDITSKDIRHLEMFWEKLFVKNFHFAKKIIEFDTHTKTEKREIICELGRQFKIFSIHRDRTNLQRLHSLLSTCTNKITGSILLHVLRPEFTQTFVVS